MILDSIFNFFLNCLDSLLSSFLSDSIVSLEIPEGAFNAFENLFGCLGYLFPIGALLPILVTSVGLSLFHTVYALVLRIYNIFWGS